MENEETNKPNKKTDMTGKAQINCWVPVETFKQIKEKNWKFSYVVVEGVKFLNNRTSIREDVEETREKTEKLKKINARLQERMFYLEQEMENQKRKNDTQG